ncbi:MAG: recombinase family protein [Gammaproteobacteria bacterium]|nr:recombinase family protein [Gammaproteobacteria bacterium]MBU1655010.1 recombinase family protein [Gammaproteobacteria bacterium]MBU1960031.1 recombinase family protein [Gammaproteobacteria bacterium]
MKSAPETESFAPSAAYDRERSTSYNRYLTGQGLGPSAIARRLNDEHWPTAKVGCGGWRESSVKSLTKI